MDENLNSAFCARCKEYIKNIGLSAILLFSLLYSYTIFYSKFAERHIQLPFLNFPIFVGEILLIFCVLLVCLLFGKQLFIVCRWSKAQWLLAFFILFILIKASIGYIKWGPLAFRNAALFYYSIFALFAYVFFDREFFKNKIIYFLILLMLFLTIALRWPNHYYRYTYLLFFLAVILAAKRKTLIVVGIIFIIISLPRQLLLAAPRGEIIADMIAAIFLFISLFSCFRVKKMYGIVSSVFLIVLIGVCSYMFANKTETRFLLISKSDIKSLISPITVFKGYIDHMKIIDANAKDFKQTRAMPVKLYESDIPLPENAFVLEEAEIEKPKSGTKKLGVAIVGTSEVQEEVPPVTVPLKKSDTITKQVSMEIENAVPKGPELHQEILEDDVIDNNIAWRLFIWGDMLKELIASHNIVFGIDFGKPFRSKSIEVLNWAYGWWVGWLEPHNSYIHILYRSGAAGVLFIITIFTLFMRIAFSFILKRDIVGILLCSVLVYWIVLSNSEVILELPYFAIPFWSLFGITFAYHDKYRLP